MSKKVLATILVLGLTAWNIQPLTYTASAEETPDGSTSGVSILIDESFEQTADHTVPEGWTATGDWGVGYAGDPYGQVLSGDEFHTPYVENADTRITLPALNLMGATSAHVELTAACDTEYVRDTDFMAVQASTDGSSYETLISWNEVSLNTDESDEGYASGEINTDIPSSFFVDGMRLALRWVTNGEDNDHGGCFVDNIVVTAAGVGDDDNDDNDDNNGTTTLMAVLSNTPSNPTTETSVSITVGGTGITQYKYHLHDFLGDTYSDPIAVSEPIVFTDMQPGSYVLDVLGGDDSGNWQSEDTLTRFEWTITGDDDDDDQCTDSGSGTTTDDGTGTTTDDGAGTTTDDGTNDTGTTTDDGSGTTCDDDDDGGGDDTGTTTDDNGTGTTTDDGTDNTGTTTDNGTNNNATTTANAEDDNNTSHHHRRSGSSNNNNSDGRVLGASARAADRNGDDEINMDDLRMFLADLVDGDLDSDFTGDGKVDLFDFNFLMIHWTD
jgi:hypothetical protein